MFVDMPRLLGNNGGMFARISESPDIQCCTALCAATRRRLILARRGEAEKRLRKWWGILTPRICICQRGQGEHELHVLFWRQYRATEIERS